MVTPRHRTASIGDAGGAAGYSLVVVIMVVTVLNIMLAAAMPKWSEMIKRDKEEELISRGFQYAEAIRVFQKRYGRLPTRLDELVKAKPRSIRQLWKDPMTQDGQWELIFPGQGSPIHPPGGPQLTPGQGLDPNQPKIQAGPIVGVHSRSTDKSLLVFFGHEHYDEWEFRVEMITGGAGVSSGGVGVPASRMGPMAMALSTRWLGRPMPNFTPPGNGLPPGSIQPPGGSSIPGSRGGGPGGSTPPPPAGGKPFG
jgi:type II secretory pathway pseudopilin PulG